MAVSVKDLCLAHGDDDGLTKLVVQDAAKVVIHTRQDRASTAWTPSRRR